MFVRSCIKLVVVAAVGVSGSQKGDNFRVIDRLFVVFFLTSPPLVNTCGRRWEEEPEKWTGNRRFIFLLPSSYGSRSFRASLKMSRSPCLAHEVPVMEATVTKNYNENI